MRKQSPVDRKPSICSVRTCLAEGKHVSGSFFLTHTTCLLKRHPQLTPSERSGSSPLFTLFAFWCHSPSRSWNKIQDDRRTNSSFRIQADETIICTIALDIFQIYFQSSFLIMIFILIILILKIRHKKSPDLHSFNGSQGSMPLMIQISNFFTKETSPILYLIQINQSFKLNIYYLYMFNTISHSHN